MPDHRKDNLVRGTILQSKTIRFWKKSNVDKKNATATYIFTKAVIAFVL